MILDVGMGFRKNDTGPIRRHFSCLLEERIALFQPPALGNVARKIHHAARFARSELHGATKVHFGLAILLLPIR